MGPDQGKNSDYRKGSEHPEKSTSGDEHPEKSAAGDEHPVSGATGDDHHVTGHLMPQDEYCNKEDLIAQGAREKPEKMRILHQGMNTL